MRFIISVIIFIYLFRLLIKYLLPILVKNTINKKFGNQFQQNYTQQKKYKEGETIIDKKPKKGKKSNVVGEYIEFEEIKDDE